MKILNISMCATFTYGLGYQENLLPRYQKKLGHDVTLITTDLTRNGEGGMKQVPCGEEILEDGVRLVRIHKNKLNSLLGYYPELDGLIEKYAPDLIFAHNCCTHIPAQAIRYQKKHPHVVLISDNHQDEGNGGKPGLITDLTYAHYKRCWKRWSGKFYKVYGTTAWRAAYAQKKYGIPAEKLDTLLMGVDTDRLPDDFDAVRREVRRELNIPEDAFVFFHGGKLIGEKRVVESLRAFCELEDRSTHLILLGKLFDDIKSEVLEILSQNDRIHYLGFIGGEEVKKYLIASDFGLFPRRHSVIWEEAIGCGLPCVFGKYADGNHMDICGNCILLEDATQENISAILRRVTTDTAYFNSLKENARQAMDALSYYTIARKSLEGTTAK